MSKLECIFGFHLFIIPHVKDTGREPFRYVIHYSCIDCAKYEETYSHSLCGTMKNVKDMVHQRKKFTERKYERE